MSKKTYRQSPYDFNLFGSDKRFAEDDFFSGSSIVETSLNEVLILAELLQNDELIFDEINECGLFLPISLAAYRRAVLLIDEYGSKNRWYMPSYFDAAFHVKYSRPAGWSLRSGYNKMLPLSLVRHVCETKLGREKSIYHRPYWKKTAGFNLTSVNCDASREFVNDRLLLQPFENPMSRDGSARFEYAGSAELLLVLWEVQKLPAFDKYSKRITSSLQADYDVELLPYILRVVEEFGLTNRVFGTEFRNFVDLMSHNEFVFEDISSLIPLLNGQDGFVSALRGDLLSESDFE